MPGFPTGGVGTHYGDTSIVEDVTDVIFQITPEDTPFYNMASDSRSNAIVHEWQQRSLTTRQENAAPEGFTYTFTAQMRLPTRVTNVNQIFEKEIRVSNSEVAAGHYAIRNLFQDQMTVKMTEWKTDVEHGMLQGTDASGTSTGAARKMQGIIRAVLENGTTYTDFTGQATMGETAFNDMIQLAWDQGGEPRDVLVNGRPKRAVSQFTASSTKFIEAQQQRLVNTIQVYESDFFPVSIALSRDIPSANASINSFLFVDRTMVSKAWLRAPMAKRVPETADSHDGVVVGELTLNYGNPNAHVYVERAQVSVG